MTSILTSTKKLLGIEESVEHFDAEIVMNINSAIMFLDQINIGPSGYMITDKTELWTDLLGDRTDLESVKMYIGLKTRILFDPPTSAYVLDAMERQIAQLEWRLLTQAEVVVTPVVEEVV